MPTLKFKEEDLQILESGCKRAIPDLETALSKLFNIAVRVEFDSMDSEFSLKDSFTFDLYSLSVTGNCLTFSMPPLTDTINVIAMDKLPEKTNKQTEEIGRVILNNLENALSLEIGICKPKASFYADARFDWGSNHSSSKNIVLCSFFLCSEQFSSSFGICFTEESVMAIIKRLRYAIKRYGHL